MKNFHWSWTKIITISLVLVIIIFVVKITQEIINRRSLNNELANLNQQITNLQGKQQELENLMTYLESSDFIEKEARTRLNLRKDGERVIIIPSSSTNNNLPASATITTTTIKELTNFQKWWQYIFPNKKYNY